MRRVGYFSIVALAALLATGCVSTDWEARYLEKEMEARALQEQVDSINQALAEQEAASDLMQEELDRSRGQVQVLSAQVDELEKRKTQPAPQAARAPTEDLERLRGKYGPMVRQTPDGNIEITLSSDITFASGSYALVAEGKRILDSVAGELSGAFRENQIRVIGHTDSDPIKKSPFKDNWELGAERASEVVRYLSTNHGISKSRLEAASKGDTSPIADNKTAAGKKKNRRVEIVVVMPQ